jgi:DnaJ-class molecular chaperone
VRLKGRGVKRKEDVGDLYVRFLVQLPEVESREVEAAIDALEQATPPGVRAGIAL